jgi:uncharacterized membrane protein YhaH (DUF805 family)
MFKTPFSFNGRIRRLEFGISFIIYLVVYFVVAYLSTVGGDLSPVILLIAYIPLLWFLWAQGSKRCHDLGRTGWMQIVPFYFLWMIFQDGYAGRNEYGASPKFPDNLENIESETLDGHLRNQA